MPYKNRRGRKPYRRNNYFRKNNITYGQVVDKVVKDVGRLKSLINVEFKSADTAVVGLITTTPNIALINAPAVGDDFDEREGRSVRFKSV